ncbi:MAG: hypothetical protein HWE13_05635 [Gammaproteobacteria bacterium]|nr:hypothetical protein [Gammaproteobacteria bacterium]
MTLLYQAEPFKQSSMVTAGLNMHHVFNLDEIPASLIEPAQSIEHSLDRYSNLILIGHGGPTLWQQLPASYRQKQHPIDEFSQDQFCQFMQQHYPSVNFKVLYPRYVAPQLHFNLQAFGRLAGWHHDSPLKVGINDTYGTWFAYRLLVITNGDLPVTAPVKSVKPCIQCQLKPCITHCPAAAITEHEYELTSCFNFRKHPQSHCSDRCLARMACPVASTERYSLEQIQYHYQLSRQHFLE